MPAMSDMPSKKKTAERVERVEHITHGPDEVGQVATNSNVENTPQLSETVVFHERRR